MRHLCVLLVVVSHITAIEAICKVPMDKLLVLALYKPLIIIIIITICLYAAGKLITCQVSGFATKRPHGEQLDQANPVRSETTELWQCPFCKKDTFPELSKVRIMQEKRELEGEREEGRGVSVRER